MLFLSKIDSEAGRPHRSFCGAHPCGFYVTFASPDCGGIELVDNQVYGTKSLYQGLQKPAVNRGNRLMKYDADVPRPKPREPSIYEWQVRNRKK